VSLTANFQVLDIGSGLGGRARTLAETYGFRVTGNDMTQAFCDAPATLSRWVGLGGRVSFRQGDATSLPFADGQFDAAMNIHVAMNIASKDEMYEEARRVLKRGSRFGGLRHPARRRGRNVISGALRPRAIHRSFGHICHAVALDGCRVQDCGRARLRGGKPALVRGTRGASSGVPGKNFPEKARNQVDYLRDRRIRTVSSFARFELYG